MATTDIGSIVNIDRSLNLSDLASSRPLTTPGPMTMAELHRTPRRLEPISRMHSSTAPSSSYTRGQHEQQQASAARKQRRRTKKAARERPPEVQSGLSSEDLIGEASLNQLRARLDPMYNLPPTTLPFPSPSSSLPPVTGQRQHHSEGTEEAAMTTDDASRETERKKVKQRHDRGSSASRRKRRESRKRKNSQDTSPPHAGGPRGNGLEPPHMGGPHGNGLETSSDGMGTGTLTNGVVEADGAMQHENGSMGTGVLESEGEGTTTVVGQEGTASLPASSPVRQLPTLPSDSLLPSSGSPMGETQVGVSTVQRHPLSHPDDPVYLIAEEDIKDAPPDREEERTRAGGMMEPAVPQSSHTRQALADDSRGVVFVERRDGHGFVPQHKNASSIAFPSRSGEGTVGDVSTIQFALYTHKVVQRLAMSFHGFLAGISLWDCVVSNVLSRQSRQHIDLLQYYSPFTLPVHAVYVLLLSVVMVSLLDRLDLMKVNKSLLEGLFVKRSSHILLVSAAAFLLLLVAFLVTLGAVAIDERIALYPNQPLLWSDILIAVNTTSQGLSSPPPSPSPLLLPSPITHTQGDTVYGPVADSASVVSSRLGSWLALVTVRALCCCGSWVLIIWCTECDRLEENLLNAESSTAIPEKDTTS